MCGKLYLSPPPNPRSEPVTTGHDCGKEDQFAKVEITIREGEGCDQSNEVLTRCRHLCRLPHIAEQHTLAVLTDGWCDTLLSFRTLPCARRIGRSVASFTAAVAVPWLFPT